VIVAVLFVDGGRPALNLGGISTLVVLVGPFIMCTVLGTGAIVKALQAVVNMGRIYMGRNVFKRWKFMQWEFASRLRERFVYSMITEEQERTLTTGQLDMVFAKWWNLVIIRLMDESHMTEAEARDYMFQINEVEGDFLGGSIADWPRLSVAPGNPSWNSVGVIVSTALGAQKRPVSNQ